MAETLDVPRPVEATRAGEVPASRAPILVTGAHRSGTTWVGRMIAESPGIHYVHEPFNVSDPPAPGVCAVRFRHWFTYVCRENEGPYLEPIRRTVSLEYDVPSAVRTILAERRRGLAREGLRAWRTQRRQRREGARALLKDPLALFSAPWLADRFGMRVVVVIRHPAAFAASLVRLGWGHPFSHFLEQPLLLRDVLAGFEEEIRMHAASPRPLLEQAILLWRLIYRTVHEYRARYPGWILARHEDLSRAPIAGYRALIREVGGTFTAATEERIRDYCGLAEGAGTAPLDASPFSVRRDSAASLELWRTRLAPQEIRRVRHGTDDVAQNFYRDEDW